jgi:hypothetical protein
MRKLVWAAVLACGCGVNPAPGDLDGLLHWLWAHHSDADEAASIDAVRKFHAATDPNTMDSDRGTISRLAASEIASLDLPGAHDVSKARGLFIVTTIQCTLDALEPLLYALDQDVKHPGSYDTYKRTYTSSIDDYKSRATEEVSWTADMTASPMGNKYSESLVGGLRRVAASSSGAAPKGPALFAHTYMPNPAKMEDSGNAFPQDYQVEAYWERTPGTVTHAFGFWRQMKMGSLDTEGDFLVKLQLNGMADWDSTTESFCKPGG